MKTFSATHLNKHAQEVFAAAKDDGSVMIEHSNYFGGVFAIVWNPDMDIDAHFDKIEADFSVFASKDLIGDKFTVQDAMGLLNKRSHEGLTMDEYLHAKSLFNDKEDKE